MKTIKRTLILALMASIISLVGCKKDKDAPKPNNTSSPPQTSTCDEGYTGANCQTQITPSKIRITKITVTKFPQYDNGSPWDNIDIGDSRPELFVEFLIGSTSLFSTGYYQDANYNQSYDFTGSSYLPFDIISPTSSYTIRAWDYDTGANDYIGGFIFTPYHSTNGFPSIIYVSSSTLEFKIYVSYYF